MNTIWSAKELFHFIIARNENHLYTQVIQFSYDDIRGVLYTQSGQGWAYFWEERWDLVQNLEFYLQFYQTNFITLKVVQYFLVLWPSVRGKDQHHHDGQERQEDGCHQHTGGSHIEYRNRHFQFLSDCLPLSVLRGVLPPVEVTECPPTAAELERGRLPLAERSEETLLPTLLSTPAALRQDNWAKCRSFHETEHQTCRTAVWSCRRVKHWSHWGPSPARTLLRRSGEILTTLLFWWSVTHEAREVTWSIENTEANTTSGHFIVRSLYIGRLACTAHCSPLVKHSHLAGLLCVEGRSHWLHLDRRCSLSAV